MKLKRFNELNELNEDKNDGANKLSKETLDKIKELIKELDKETNTMVKEDFQLKSELTSNKLESKLTIVNEKEYKEIIKKHIKDSYYDDFDVKDYDNNDSAFRLIVKENDDKYEIPVIINVSGDDFIYSNSKEIKYSVWINTYVTKKI